MRLSEGGGGLPTYRDTVRVRAAIYPIRICQWHLCGDLAAPAGPSNLKPAAGTSDDSKCPEGTRSVAWMDGAARVRHVLKWMMMMMHCARVTRERCVLLSGPVWQRPCSVVAGRRRVRSRCRRACLAACKALPPRRTHYLASNLQPRARVRAGRALGAGVWKPRRALPSLLCIPDMQPLLRSYP